MRAITDSLIGASGDKTSPERERRSTMEASREGALNPALGRLGTKGPVGL